MGAKLRRLDGRGDRREPGRRPRPLSQPGAERRAQPPDRGASAAIVRRARGGGGFAAGEKDPFEHQPRRAAHGCVPVSYG